MFDISFGEFLLIGIVALVVLGPERLPAVARTVGALVARAQRFAASVKSDIQQQTDLAGLSSLSSLKQEVQSTAYALRAQFESELQTIHAETVRTEVVALPDNSQPITLDDTIVRAQALASPVPPAPGIEPEAVVLSEVPVAHHSAPESPVSEPVVSLPEINENQLDLFADPAANTPRRETHQ